jgi:integrase
MATIYIDIDKKYKLKQDLYPLRVYFRHNGTASTMTMKIHLKLNQWNNLNKRIVSHPYAESWNKLLQNLNFKLQYLISLIKLNKHSYPIKNGSELKKLYLQISDNLDNLLQPTSVNNNLITNLSNKTIKESVNFVDYFNEFMLEKTDNTQESYKYSLSKLLAFAPNITTFEEISYSFLKHFEKHLRQTLSVNTTSIVFRNIRAVFNEAINEEIIPENLYPFNKFHIKNQETAKRCLSVEELVNIRDKALDANMIQHRDVFMLFFYFIGINIRDLCSPLTKIKNGRLEYRRAKTSRLYSIRVEPEAMQIVEKYKGGTHLLNFLDTYKDVKNYKSFINRKLKKIHSNLSTYYARHTWATLAAELDIPKETIAAALGHKGGTTTDIYIKFNPKKIDEANRAVIDYVNSIKL